MNEKITYDDFKKVEVRAGEILSAERIEGSEKLLKLSVNFGLKTSAQTECSPEPEAKGEEKDVRQIVSGILAHFPDPSVLVGKKCMFVTNLEPRKLMGLESDGMLFAVGGTDSPFSLLEVASETPPGTRAN